MEWLKNIRERTERRPSKKASLRRGNANRRVNSWSFADIQTKTAYKTRLADGVLIWVDADYTSQGCPISGHTGRENRPNKGLLFVCAHCSHTLLVRRKTGRGRGDCQPPLKHQTTKPKPLVFRDTRHCGGAWMQASVL